MIDAKFFESFGQTYINILLHDPYTEVRISALKPLAEILKLIGIEECHKTMKDTVKLLHKEEDFSLLTIFLDSYPKILDAFFDADFGEEKWHVLYSNFFCEFARQGRFFQRIP